MRNAYNYLWLSTNATMVMFLILSALVILPLTVSKMSAQTQPNQFSAIGLDVIDSSDPQFSTKLANFLGDSSYPEAMRQHGFLVTNKKSEKIIGFTVQYIYELEPNGRRLEHNIFLHHAIENPNARQYDIGKEETTWISLTFAVNQKTPPPSPELLKKFLESPLYDKRAKILAMNLDCIIKENGRIYGPDKLNSLRKLQEERRARNEIAARVRSAMANGRSAANELGHAVAEVKAQRQGKRLELHGDNAEWYEFTKIRTLERFSKLAETMSTERISTILDNISRNQLSVSK